MRLHEVQAGELARPNGALGTLAPLASWFASALSSKHAFCPSPQGFALVEGACKPCQTPGCTAYAPDSATQQCLCAECKTPGFLAAPTAAGACDW